MIGVSSDTFKISRQVNTYTCGSRAVFMVLRFFGVKVPHAVVKKEVGTTYKKGTHETDMQAYLERCGLRSTVRMSLTWPQVRAVLSRGGVVIASVDGDDHYVVVHGVDDNVVHLADPFEYRPHRRQVSQRTFLERWDRWGIVVSAP